MTINSLMQRPTKKGMKGEDLFVLRGTNSLLSLGIGGYGVKRNYGGLLVPS